MHTYFDGSTYSTAYTTWRTIKKSVTPTQTPYSTSTYSYTDDLELVYAYYSQGAVADSDLVPSTSYNPSATSTSLYTYTAFYMAVTYTAPSSCPTQFTWSTYENVHVPTQVVDQITPISKTTSAPHTYSTYTGAAYETWYLSAGAAPITTTSEYYYTSYIANCKTPYSYSYPTGSSSGGGGSSSGIEVCSWYSGCTSLKTWVIIVATILPSLFVLGFIENYFYFRRLMLGKGTLRFGTICWIMISLWVACFTRKQDARSKEDQKLLREKWNQTGSWEAFKLWWKWGFRHAYPVALLGQYSPNTVGIVPEGQPLPQPGQTGTVMYYAPGPGVPPQYPSGVPPGAMAPGQPYYPPPQGWSPVPQGQGYPMPPPGQAYMVPPPQSVSPLSYPEQSKEAPIVTETPTGQAPPTSEITSSPPTVAATPPANVAEAPTQPPQEPAQLPTEANEQPQSAPQPPTGPPPPKQG